MSSRLFSAAIAACAVGASAQAQVHQVVFSPHNGDQPAGSQHIDCGVAASPTTVVVSSNMTLGAYSRAGNRIEQFNMGQTGFPFHLSDPAGIKLFDPRCEYDVVNDRLWVLYTERTYTGDPLIDRPLHIGVSKADSDPGSLSSEDWWFYTGNFSNPGNGGAALQSGDRYSAPADHSFMSVDHQACYIFCNTRSTGADQGIRRSNHHPADEQGRRVDPGRRSAPLRPGGSQAERHHRPRPHRSRAA